MLELHPDMTRLRSFGLGRLSAAEAMTVEQHILECEECCEKLRDVGSGGDPLIHLARDAARNAPRYDSLDDSHIPPELVNHPRYEVLEQLGEGGMGTVFKAHHRFMDRVVALKVIQRKFVNKPDAVERFRNEVRMAAKLHHPNIVASHDAEECSGLHFLVMEYVEGISLDRFVAKQKGAIPYPLACHMIRQAAIGLQHAHKNGLVHRDIKPQNMMMTRRGQIKILDFGLTRLTADRAGDPNVTRDNLVVGTPDFIAPEQARNSRDVDIRTDIYALGCTFYFLLARRVPFPGLTPFEKMIAHTEIEPEPVNVFRKDLPAELEAILKKMMSKNREDRYDTPAEVVAALAPFASLNLSTAANGSAAPASSAIETDVEVVSDQVDTDELNDSHTHRIPATTRPRPATRPSLRPPRRRRKQKDLPYGKWIAGSIIGTCLMFGLIFMVATQSRPEGETKRNSSDFIPVAKLTEKSMNEKSFPAPASSATLGDEPSLKAAVEPSIVPRDPNSFIKPRGFTPQRTPAPRGKNDAWEGFAPLRGKSVLLVVPNRNAWFPDVEPVRQLLEDRGALVLVASSENRTCVGLGGSKRLLEKPFRTQIDLSNNLDPERYKSYSAVICGGGDMNEFLNPRLRANVDKLLDIMERENRVIAGIGAGQVLLARTGHLDGKEAAKVTFAPALKQYELDEKRYPKVQWSERKVVRSGNCITSGSSDHANDFAEEIAKLLMESR